MQAKELSGIESITGHLAAQRHDLILHGRMHATYGGNKRLRYVWTEVGQVRDLPDAILGVVRATSFEPELNSKRGTHVASLVAGTEVWQSVGKAITGDKVSHELSFGVNSWRDGATMTKFDLDTFKESSSSMQIRSVSTFGAKSHCCITSFKVGKCALGIRGDLSGFVTGRIEGRDARHCVKCYPNSVPEQWQSAEEPEIGYD